MARYRVPGDRARIELRVSNSRFIATITPAATMTAAQQFLREMRAEMPDATHHVYAFKIGYGPSVTEAMSDDGEPSGTSGPPALAVLRGADIGDVALVITRYFGGTKLGAGGLVSAYGEAAKRAIAAVKIVEKIDRCRVELSVPYALHDTVRRGLAAWEALLDGEDFAADVNMRLRVPRDRVADFVRAMRDLSAGKIEPRVAE